MRKIILFVFLFSLVLFGIAEAVTLNLPGRTIDVNKSPESGGAVNIKTLEGGSLFNVNKSTDGETFNITTPSSTTNVSPNSVQINSGGVPLVNMNKDSSGAISIEVGSQKIKVNSTKDLEIYKQLILNDCLFLQDINTDGDKIEIKFNQPARLFGLFKTDIDAKINVDEIGKAQIKLPWYKFLFSKNTKGIESQLQTGINNSLSVPPGSQRKALIINSVNEVLSSNITPCKAPTTTNTTAGVVFGGEWSGSYNPDPATSNDCKPGGEVGFDIDNNGKVVGYATISGAKIPGIGTVDGSGNLKGTWNFSGAALSFSGKLNSATNQGSGSYQNNLGCFGDFSVSRK